jgi:hypothetical protein
VVISESALFNNSCTDLITQGSETMLGKNYTTALLLNSNPTPREFLRIFDQPFGTAAAASGNTSYVYVCHEIY